MPIIVYVCIHLGIGYFKVRGGNDRLVLVIESFLTPLALK